MISSRKADVKSKKKDEDSESGNASSSSTSITAGDETEICATESSESSSSSERVVRFSKNVQIVYIFSETPTAESGKAIDFNTSNNQFDPNEFLAKRNEFQKTLTSNPLYANNKRIIPWKMLSKISDDLLTEVLDSVRKQSIDINPKDGK